MPTFNGNHRYANFFKVLTNRVTELEKLLNDKVQAKHTIENQ